MKRFLIAALAALILPMALTACASQTPMDRVTILEQALTAAETGFIAYTRLPDCDTAAPPCSSDEVIIQAGKLDQEAFEAIQNYRDGAIAASPESVLTELFNAAQAAIMALNAFIP